jgi:hypothetical protein
VVEKSPKSDLDLSAAPVVNLNADDVVSSKTQTYSYCLLHFPIQPLIGIAFLAVAAPHSVS